MKNVFLLIGTVLCTGFYFCAPLDAQDTSILSMVSPKLRQFLDKNSQTVTLLTNTIAEAYSNRTVQIFYFYADDPTAPKAYHYYPAESTVGICICENQAPIDEYASLIYESFNSENEGAFVKLAHRAQTGDLSKTNYAREVLKLEFKAVQRTQSQMKTLKFKETEIAGSHSYTNLLKCPDTFEEFIKYTGKISPTGDALKEYEVQYDMIKSVGH